MNSKSAGIYSITSKTNGKRYIGSSTRISDRWIAHRKELKNKINLYIDLILNQEVR